MKIALIGCTGHTGYVLGGWTPEMTLVGLSKGSEGEDLTGVLGAMSRQGVSGPVFEDPKRMLDQTKPDIVVVTPWFCDHARWAQEVLSRGLNLFIEKPIALTLEDLADIEAAWRNSKTHLAAMFGIRYDPAIYTAWRAVQDGAMGQVRLVTAQKSYRLGTRPDYYKKRSTYGGTLPWVGSHSVDWLRWFTGREFRAVTAHHSTMHNRGHGELEMSALAQFTFDDEVIGSTNVDYLRPANAPTHGDDRVRVAGTDGVIEVRDGKAWLINGEAPGQRELPLGRPGELFTEFARQVSGGAPCLVQPEDAFRVTEACLLARQSADEQRTIEFPSQ